MHTVADEGCTGHWFPYTSGPYYATACWWLLESCLQCPYIKTQVREDTGLWPCSWERTCLASTSQLNESSWGHQTPSWNGFLRYNLREFYFPCHLEFARILISWVVVLFFFFKLWLQNRLSFCLLGHAVYVLHYQITWQNRLFLNMDAWD